MNIYGIFDTLTPRVCSRIISLVIAFILTFGGFKGYEAISALKTHGEKPEEGAGDTLQSGAVGTAGKNEGEKIFSDEGARDVSGEVSAEGALFCDVSNMKIIAQKEKTKVINCGDLSVFATALLVSRAIDSGRINETDFAVCPASAQKRPNYQLSAGVLPVGKKMMVKDILRCLIYQRGSSFAYTLAVHISGSEEAFVSELNALAAELKMTETAFASVCGDEDGISKTTVLDTAVLLKAFLSDARLKGIFCSSEPLTVKSNEAISSVYLTVANDFFVSNCTEGQARADGISGGKVGAVGSGRWSAVLFTKGEIEYLAITVNSPSPYAEILKLYAALL